MARPRTFDKEEVLEKILHMMWHHGSSCLSLDEIAKRLNLSKTSLYSAFGNKDAVLSQCLDLYEQLYEQPMLASFKGDTISECINNFLNFSRLRFDEDQTPAGCFMFNCAIEGTALSAELKAKVAINNMAFRDKLKQKVLDKKPSVASENVENFVDMVLINLFGLASASRMNFPLMGCHLSLLDNPF